jgi:hypothetical protein
MAGAGDLPPGWTEHVNEQGIPYYYNANLGISSWDRPGSQETTAEVEDIQEPETKRIRLGAGDDDTETNQAEETLSPERRRAQLDQKKARLQERLGTRDEIFDPKVVTLLKDWVATVEALAELNKVTDPNLLNSCATEASKLLSEGYDGSADIANVLGSWLDLVDGPGSAAKLVHAKSRELAYMAGNLANRFQELLAEYEQPPQWLIDLLSDHAWTDFFLQVASTNPASPFSTFCVRFMAETGRYEAVAQSATASTLFSLSERTLGDGLKRLVKASQGDITQRQIASSVVTRVVQIAESSPQASLFCGQLLYDLERSPELQPATRYALAHVRQRVQHFGLKLLHRGGLRTDSPVLASCLAKVLSGERDACEASTDIYDCYQAERKPPLWPLSEREFLDRLVSGLFRPHRKLDHEVRKRASFVLSLAASTNPQDGTQTSEEERKALSDELEQCSAILNDPATINALDANWVDLQPLCEAHPTISMGILFWARSLLASSDFLQSLSFQQTFLTICKIARVAGNKHPLQRSYVFAVLKRALEARPSADDTGALRGAYISDAKLAELAENVVDAMVDLMSTGFVMPVLEHFLEQAPRLDTSLLRKFLMGVMEVARPPYSKVFRDKVESILECTPGRRAGLGGGVQFSYLKQKFLAAPTN